MQKTLLILATLAVPALADIRLPAIISDHMVLQQEAAATLWGWADAGEKITATFADKKAETTTKADGTWLLRLPNLKAGTTGTLTIVGKNTHTINDVLVGEVWVGSGQSNMEWRVDKSANPDTEKTAANFPKIREFQLQRKAIAVPQDDCTGKWVICTPETIGSFSAVGYYFSRHLHQKLQHPIGLIHTSWGGTNASLWTPAPIIANDPDFQLYGKKWANEQASYATRKAKYETDLADWKIKAEAAKTAGQQPPAAPRAPRGGDDYGSPGCLYNGMIAPITNYTIQGTIWYQGESNANAEEAKLYRKLFPTMIATWRHAWRNGGLAGNPEGPEMPFLFVQLANFKARHDQPYDSHWAELRESQFLTLDTPRTGMAVIIDIGEANDIHPKNKQDVGKRLGLAAEAMVYYRETEYSGPLYSGSQIEEGKIRLNLRNADGMKASDGGKIRGFAIAGEDKKFVWADVEIEGDHMVVSSPQVPKPVAVRYAWADNPDCNLVNSHGLPASPFRTDNWPQTNFPKPAPAK